VAYTAPGPAVLAVVVWPRLPAEIAIHFDATSTPDSPVARPVSVLLAPDPARPRTERESPNPAVEDGGGDHSIIDEGSILY